MIFSRSYIRSNSFRFLDW